MHIFQKIRGSYAKVGLSNKAHRQEWIINQLSSLPKGARILDAGAGELPYKKYCDHLKYVSQDFAQYDGKGDATGIQTGSWDNSKLDIVSDITAIPEPDSSFDVILCSEVFEHIPAPLEALKEFNRLLKPKGEVIITAPFCAMTHFSPYFFQTGLTSYWYQKWCDELGLRITEIHFNGNYFEYLAQELRHVEKVAERYSPGMRFNVAQKIAQRMLLAFLQRASQQDTGSKELLCFGLCVRAQKAG